MGFGARVLAGLGEAVQRRGGPLLAAFVLGVSTVAEETDTKAVGPTARGWSPALDVTESPYLAWLARTLGTPLPAGLPAAEQRAYVSARRHERRATVSEIKAAITPLLSGYRRVDVYERTPTPHRFTVRVYAAQAAGVGVPQLTAVLEPHKPLGLVATAEIATGASFDHLLAAHGPTFDDLAAAFPTFDAMTNHLPEEGSAP